MATGQVVTDAANLAKERLAGGAGAAKAAAQRGAGAVADAGESAKGATQVSACMRVPYAARLPALRASQQYQQARFQPNKHLLRRNLINL